MNATKKFNEIADLVFLVRSTPVKIDSIRVLLIILQDITIQQQRAALERTFFHDIRNMLCGVIGVSELLSIDDVNPEHIKIVQQSSKRMLKEIELQQCLIQNERFSYQSELVEITPGKIINELASYFINHPVAMGKFVNFSHSELNVLLRIDVSILLRILCNMVTNALEATDDNGIIKVWFEQEQGSISFYVWNNNSIDESTSLRIFQRNFSTKSGEGRGIGTYSMKLFGEKMLGGKVSFTTSPADGTTFKIALSC